MEMTAIKILLELAGGPAFALEDVVIRLADPQAVDLGLTPGVLLAEAWPEVVLPDSGEEAAPAALRLGGRSWLLRTVAISGLTLCFLRPAESRTPTPDERTLIHTAGSIRMALQDLLVALDSLSDTLCEDPVAANHAAMAHLERILFFFAS